MSWAAVELWKTGNRSLMAKLKSRGILHLSLRHGAPAIRVTWPRCLKEFQLRSLSLKCADRPLDSVSDLRNALSQLLPELESLELEFPGAIDIFIKSDAPPTTAPKSWSEVFPRLTTLTLSRHENRNGIVADVPATVTTLTLNHVQGLHSAKHPGISLDCSSINALESLTVDAWTGGQVLNFLKTYCPPSLRLFDCSNSWIGNLADYDFPSHHPNLKILATLALDARTMRGPPPAWVSSVAIVGGPEHCKDLPDRLHALYLRVAQTSRLETALTIFPSFLPKGLVKLQITFPPFIAKIFHALPRSLTDLQFITDKHTSLVDVATLRSFGVATITGEDAHLWKSCKQDLLEYADVHNDGEKRFVTAYIAEVESGALFGLPLGLTIVLGPYGRIIDDYHMVLPPKLRTMRLRGDMRFATKLAFFDLLPPAITSATLSGYGLNDGPSDILCDCSHFHGLQQLRTLEVTLSVSAQVARLLPLLPPLLATLTLILDNTLDQGDLISLPSNLWALTILCEGLISPPAWLNVLPRSLKHFSLQGRVFLNAADLINLPPSLERLQALINHFDIDSLYTLPKSLRVLSTEPTDKVWRMDTAGWSTFLETHQPFWRVFHLPKEQVARIIATPPAD